MKVLLTDFSGAYAAQGFLPWLQEEAGKELTVTDLTRLEGTCCYCDAQEEIGLGKRSRSTWCSWTTIRTTRNRLLAASSAAAAG